jgi:hypothetical protein
MGNGRYSRQFFFGVNGPISPLFGPTGAKRLLFHLALVLPALLAK